MYNTIIRSMHNKRHFFPQEPETKTENQEDESLPSLQETALCIQTDEGTELEHEETVTAQEPPLAMVEEMLLENHTHSDIAESELWEAQWSDVDAVRDDIHVSPHDESEEMLSSPVDTQTSESTVSDGV